MKKPEKSAKAIKNRDLAHHAHFDFIDEMEAMSMKGFDYVMSLALTALVKRCRANSRLNKADKMKRGWTGDVPKVNIDFEMIFDQTMSPYLDALRWILFGDLAGKDARSAATSIGLDERVIPGIIPSVYLNCLDTNADHFRMLFGKDAPEVRKDIITGSIENIHGRTDRFLTESFAKMRSRVIDAGEEITRQINDENLAAVHERAHQLLTDGMTQRASLGQAIKNVASNEIATPQISRALREAVDRYRDDWELMTKVDTGLASAVGTHQAINEIFGATDDELRVAQFSFRDEKTCTFCREASRKADGSFKIYKISDFEPAGFNYSRKRKDWVLCVPPSHFKCRCSLIYVPQGFGVDNSGSLVPL